MDRDEFIDLLSRLVADKLITEAEAVELLKQFDNGTLDDEWELPAPAGTKAEEDNDYLALLLLLFTNLKLATHLQRVRASNIVQDRFEAFAEDLAQARVDKTITLAEWHKTTLDDIKIHTAMQILIGSRRQELDVKQSERLDAIMAEQEAYLQRFADHQAPPQSYGFIPFSAAYIAQRASSYAGVGRGEFYSEEEKAMQANGELGDGWVAYYRSRDDRGTCGPCLDADRASPYAIGQAPRPGAICKGRGNCRCWIEYVYEPR